MITPEGTQHINELIQMAAQQLDHLEQSTVAISRTATNNYATGEKYTPIMDRPETRISTKAAQIIVSLQDVRRYLLEIQAEIL